MSKGRAVFLLFADLGDQASDADLEAWSNESYLPEVCAVPGVKDCGRYVAVKGGPKHLWFFELEDLDVAGRLMTLNLIPADGAAFGDGLLSNNAVIVGEQFRPKIVERGDRTMAPFLQIGRMSVPAAVEDAWNAWYDTEYIPGFIGVPGVIGARRYRVSTGAVRYMTVYEFETVDVSEKPEWVHQRQHSSMDTPRMREANQMADGSPGIYRWIF